MLAEAVQTIHEQTYAGVFSPRVLILCGIGLAVLFAILTWSEARSAGRRLLIGLLPFRLAAMGVVLWMLAEPSMRTVMRRSHPGAIAVMADVSASMGMVDPADDDAAKALRWAAMDELPGQATLIAPIDGMTFAFNMARRHYERLLSHAGNDNPTASLKNEVAEVKRWVQAAQDKVEELIEQVRAQGADSRPLEKTGSGLRQFLVPALAELTKSIEKGSRDFGGNDDQILQVLNKYIEESLSLAKSWTTLLQDSTDANTRDALGRQFVQSREEKAAQLLNRMEKTSLRKLAEDVEISRYTFHQSVSPWPHEEWQDLLKPADSAEVVRSETIGTSEQRSTTDLTAAMEQIEQDSSKKSIKAVVLITDGAHNAQTDPLKKAAAIGGPPVFVVPVGNTMPSRDVMLHHAQAPRRAFINDQVTVEAMLEAHECAGEQITLELLADGDVVDQRIITVSDEFFFTPVQFHRKVDRFGLTKFGMHVLPVSQEQSDTNNDANAQVEVIEATLRVFLADQMPRWEFRYLRNLWKRDEHIEMDNLLFQPAQLMSEEAGTQSKFPDTTDGWSRYRVVILGDLPASVLTPQHQENLKDYVSSRGGTLVLIAGDEAMPAGYFNSELGPLIPVQPAYNDLIAAEGWRLEITPEGRAVEATQIADDADASEVVWREMRFHDLSPFSLPRSTSQVLLRAVPAMNEEPNLSEQPAFLCWQRFGKGRVVYLAAPATWHLRFRHGDRYHHRFWGQLVRWATGSDIGSGSRHVRLVTDKLKYQLDDTIQISAHLTNSEGHPVTNAEVTVSAARNKEHVATIPLQEDPDSPASYRATLSHIQPGTLTLRVDGPQVQALLTEEENPMPVETQIVIEPSLSQELRNTRCNLPLLTKLAETTGGAVLPPTALSTALSMLDLTPDVSEEVRQEPIWPRWRYLALVVGCLCIEWIARKLNGLA